MYLDRDRSAGYLTNWAARLFARELERQLQPIGIAPAYMPIMFALARGDALTQKELARRAAVEQPTMAATLNRMQRDGLIIRSPDPTDRRSALVTLTPLAVTHLPQVEQVIQRINAHALGALEPAEQAQYLRLLRKVAEGLEQTDKMLGQ